METLLSAKEVAQVGYEAVRTYLVLLGERRSSWTGLKHGLRKHYVSIARVLLDNPLMDEPELVHDVWMVSMLEDGWSRGHFLNMSKKTHPALRPFGQLSGDARRRHRVFVAVVRALSARGEARDEDTPLTVPPTKGAQKE